MAGSNILLVESDGPGAALISAALTVAGHEVTVVGDAPSALAAAADHDLILIDILPGANTASELCASIRGTEGLEARPLLCIAESDHVEDRIRLFEAGADDVMSRPFDPAELEIRVDALLVRLGQGRSGGLVGTRPEVALGATRIVACFSPKGGVGTTSIAVNLAVTAAASAPDRVLLVDLDARWGQVATHLNLSTPRTIVDVVRDPAALQDPETLRSYAIRHESGLDVLPSPTDASLADLVGGAAAAELLETALGAYERIVVDAGSELDQRSLTVLEAADVVVIPVIADIPALKPVVQLIEYLTAIGTIGDKVTIVLNGIFERQIVTPEQIEDLLGLRIAARLPHDEGAHLRATNEGSPVVLSAPRSSAAAALTRFAGTLFGAAAPAEERRSVFGRRR